jgi:hypothetical protein
MQHWNTKKIKEIIQKDLPFYDVASLSPDGDVDTESISVSDPETDGYCSVFGMCYNGQWITDASDFDVDGIHVVYCPKYGLDEASPDDLTVVSQVSKALSAAGYSYSHDGYKSFF